ncbi:MAG: DNA polymerase III subunit gamma/tau [Betaproteobacteria bacterium]|jgi:DNA polymerase-3 subunit gamma/tau|nr:DNA polymerase III subunit gamma/tau [Betaproteobacteria bacterium]
MTNALFSSEDLPQPAAAGLQSPSAVLARKWRPKSFSQVVGQDHVVKALAHALNAQRLHHAYLLTGTRGTGKTTLARIIAKALNCESGVSANPCGVCSACSQIDGGRFVDYIEIDAASNRGVGEIQQLLEQAQFAPTAGRFKVYVIDEVHMLSNHAFNAMLKTLEEPPPDVKFLLATTDPQKIPVTVLSRCLQFNLKNVPPELLQQHLAWVLNEEKISAEPQALTWLSVAAQGSVRDGLSLTDQAIAYGGGQITEPAVRAMLGLVQRELLGRFMHDIVRNDPQAAFATLEELQTSGASADALLADMARCFHQASALATLKIESRDDPSGAIEALAQHQSPETLQLNYQIVTLGRRDLRLAPDERTGLEMTLLRLFAFQPAAIAPSVAPASPPRSAPRPQAIAAVVAAPRTMAAPSQSRAVPATAAAALPAASLTAQQWPAVSRSLAVSGLARQFVQQAKLVAFEDLGRSVRLQFRVAIPALTESSTVSKAQEALATHFGKPCKIDVELGEAETLTAAAEDADAAAQAQAQAEAQIHADPMVQSILNDFGGKIVPGSIRSTRKGSPG